MRWIAWVLGTIALAGCPTVDYGQIPGDIGACNPVGGETYFDDHIWPEYLAAPSTLQPGRTCLDSGCHGHGAFSGGLGFDVTNPTSSTNYRAAQNEISCDAPDASKLLTWPEAGVDPHGGGDLFAPTDPQVQTFLAWFQ